MGLVALALGPAPARAAGASPEDLPLERAATARGYGVVVLEVLRADPGAPTHEHPPMLAVRVERVLLGKGALGTRVARWMPPPFRTAATGPYAERLARAWAETPLPAPAAGERYLALVHDAGGVTEIMARYRPRATAPAEDALLTLAAESKAASWSARKAARRLLAARAKDEALRLAEVDPGDLAARATVVVVGRLAPLAPGADGRTAVVSVSEALRGVDPETTELTVALPTPEEQARYVAGRPLILFLAPSRWYEPDGAIAEGLRPVDPRFAVLPARRPLVRAVTAAL
ncbi:MAG: hypothetical protein H6745_30955 [Deltaproteobacteria bacterium]|nr:hypothetical protein [Deltaproteobacteria bacterium]